MTDVTKLRITISEDRDYGTVFAVCNDHLIVAEALKAIALKGEQNPLTKGELELAEKLQRTESARDSANSDYYKELNKRQELQKELDELKAKIDTLGQVNA